MREIAVLEKAAIFSLLERRELGELAEHLATVTLHDGEILFLEGDEGNDLYIVKNGKVSVGIRLPDGTDHEITRFSAGDFFGDMSIFDNAPRSATCRAVEETSLYSLSKAAFSDIIRDHPRIALKLMYRMLNVTTQRLRNTSELVSDMVIWGESARKRAVTDELTGVYNRRFLEDSLGNYMAEAREKGEALSLIIVDLDYFRRINERYGNAKGDEAIREATRLFTRFLRQRDVVARYGGDEFMILLPGAVSTEAMAVASAICAEVSTLSIAAGADGATIGVTVSMGIASYPQHAGDLPSLRSAADAALYRAKEGGRNRVLCAEG